LLSLTARQSDTSASLRDRIFIELMTSDRELEASKEGLTLHLLLWIAACRFFLATGYE
jgi:hypothetical protein